MSRRALRKFVMTVIILLVAGEFARWMGGLVGAAGGFLGGLLLAAMMSLCGLLAETGSGGRGYFLFSIFLFATLAAVGMCLNTFKLEDSWWGAALGVATHILGFVLPLGLLVRVYLGLGKREETAGAHNSYLMRSG